MREIEELSQYLTDDKVRGLRKVLGRDIQEKLSKSGIYFHIFSRLKSAGSIWHKLEWKKEEYIEKETGLIIHSTSEIGERNITYRFNDITDEEIEMPDINQYEHSGI